MATANCTAPIPYACAYDKLTLKLQQVHSMLLLAQSNEGFDSLCTNDRSTYLSAAADYVRDCEKLADTARSELLNGAPPRGSEAKGVLEPFEVDHATEAVQPKGAQS
jgi:hypothetical protein